MMGFIRRIFGPKPDIDEGFDLSEHSSGRKAPPDTILWHDSAGPNSTPGSLVRTLDSRGLSTHYSLDSVPDEPGEEADLDQHVPCSEAAWHGGAWNGRSIGVDDVNRVDPRTGKPRPGQEVIKAPAFAGFGGRVNVPSPAQLERGYQLVLFLLSEHPTIRAEWPAVQNGRFHWSAAGELPDEWTRDGGILAHAHVSSNRADGLTQNLYQYLRHSGFGADDAWDALLAVSANATRGPGRLWSARIPEPPTATAGALTLALAAIVTAVIIWGKSLQPQLGRVYA